jgi:hypothetical protein
MLTRKMSFPSTGVSPAFGSCLEFPNRRQVRGATGTRQTFIARTYGRLRSAMWPKWGKEI